MKKTTLINGFPFDLHEPALFTESETVTNSELFYNNMNGRRSCRDFSNKPVNKRVIENIIKTASTAPSGAHKQPWTFCAVSDPIIKSKIRIAAEKEEFDSYNGRMPEAWKKDLLPLQTDWNKSFLEIAPFLIVVFKKSFELNAEGGKTNTYYATESCGIACGFLLAAIHHAGLVGLTHTPSPMNFLKEILNRPVNEKAFLLIPVGYPAEECWVPALTRKPLNEIAQFY